MVCRSPNKDPRQFPKIFFHLLASQDDFANNRYKIYLKKISQLQINRLLEKLNQEFTLLYEKEDDKLNLKEITAHLS
jgi:hypothetical protein